MSKAEIFAELPKLHRADLMELQAKLDELLGDSWLDDTLSEEDKAALDSALADFEKNPNAGSSWEQVEARIRTKLRQ